MTGIGIFLLAMGAAAPPIGPAPSPPSPVFVTLPDPRLADIMEERLEFDRQQAEAESRRAEAEEHRRRVEAQTPKGPSTTTTYSDLPVGNPLAGTGAQSCRLSNGTTIQASGGFRSDSCQK